MDAKAKADITADTAAPTRKGAWRNGNNRNSPNHNSSRDGGAGHGNIGSPGNKEKAMKNLDETFVNLVWWWTRPKPKRRFTAVWK